MPADDFTHDLVDLAERSKKAEDALAPALGRLVIVFGRLEFDLGKLVAAAVGVSDDAASDAVNAVLSFRQKLDIVAALAPERAPSPEDLLRIREAIGEMGEFEAQRNMYLHSQWGFFWGDHIMERRKVRAARATGLKRSAEEANVVQIESLASDIERFRYRHAEPLFETFGRLRRALYPNRP